MKNMADYLNSIFKPGDSLQIYVEDGANPVVDNATFIKAHDSYLYIGTTDGVSLWHLGDSVTIKKL